MHEIIYVKSIVSLPVTRNRREGAPDDTCEGDFSRCYINGCRCCILKTVAVVSHPVCVFVVVVVDATVLNTVASTTTTTTTHTGRLTTATVFKIQHLQPLIQHLLQSPL